MGHFALDRVALAAVSLEPDVQLRMRKLAEEIQAESQANVLSMKVYDTGLLYDSAFIEEENGAYRIGYGLPGSGVDYARYPHEGESTSRHYGPRPFLANAALRDRGRL